MSGYVRKKYHIIIFVTVTIFACNIYAQTKLTNPLLPQLILPENQFDEISNAGIYPVQLSVERINTHHDSIAQQTNGLLQLKIMHMKKKFYFEVEPIINNLYFSSKSNNKSFAFSYNGVSLFTSATKKLSLEVNYAIGQASLPEFARSKYDSISTFPGFKKKTLAGNINKFNELSGYLIYSPAKYVDFTVGVGQNFFGNGYRSLFLSEYSAAYPYTKIHVKTKKLEYVYLLSFLQDIVKYENLTDFNKKFTATQYLSFHLHKALTINIFETVIWAPDDSSTNRSFDINYLNPVVFLRPIEFGIGSPDNVLLGLGMNINPVKGFHFYGQFILDEFNLSYVKNTDNWWANKYGYQAGMKFFKKLNPVTFLAFAEYNHVRPFTYTHSFSSKSYGNYFQPLAHPLGANFEEFIISGSINYKAFTFIDLLNVQYYAADSVGTNYGNDIYKSSDTRSLDYGSVMLQGIKQNVITNHFRINRTINPNWNMNIETGYIMRFMNAEHKSVQHFFYLGIVTGIEHLKIFDGKY